MKNIFCVDLEEWYDANLVNKNVDGFMEDRVEKNTLHLLNMFERSNTYATFFVLGSVAEKYPELIKKISAKGHEIASHGYGHQLVYTLTQEEFRQDIRRAKQITEEILGKEIVSYRAPSWSIREESFWALQVLQEEGFQYDSSIFPFKNFLYGVADAPRFEYRTKKYNEKSDLMECPPSTIRILGVNIPFSGGFYLRALPYWFIKGCIKSLNKKGKRVVMYIHPWELDPGTPKQKEINLRDKLIQYWGIRGNEKKLIKLLYNFEFDTMRAYRD